MKMRALVAVIPLLALAAPACEIQVPPATGTVMADGSVYLGFQLFSGNNKKDQEEYPVGAGLGTFSTIRLHTDDAIALTKVVVIMADGERFNAPVPKKLVAGQWTDPIALPHAPQGVYSVVVSAKGGGKQLAKLEIYGAR